mgnify:FL=1
MLNLEHIDNLKEKVTIFSFNHHANRNLVAQKGVFTYVLREDLNDNRTIDEVVKENGIADSETPLKRYDISYRMATKAMEHLMKVQKTANTFFPGYEGVVRCMKDYANYEAVLEYEKQRREHPLRQGNRSSDEATP